MPSVENGEEVAAPQVPKTELEELQIKANSVADDVSYYSMKYNKVMNCNMSLGICL